MTRSRWRETAVLGLLMIVAGCATPTSGDSSPTTTSTSTSTTSTSSTSTSTTSTSTTSTTSTSTTTTTTVAVDTTPPAGVAVDSPAAGSTITNASPTFSGTAGTAEGDAATLQIVVTQGSSVAQTLTATRTGGSWSVPASFALINGTYTVTATQSDLAGNTASSAPRTFTVVAGAQRYIDQVFSSVTVSSNITYGTALDNTGALKTLKLDVYQPTGDVVTTRPAMVWIHGGSFVAGDKSDLASEATYWARRGYVVVSINYRLEQGATWNPVGNVVDFLDDPTWVAAVTRAYEDAGNAIAWLRTNAATYRVDTTRIASAGVSAGAATALNTAFIPDRSLGQGTGSDPKRVKAAVSIVGSSLPAYVEAGEGPVFMANGTQDTIVPAPFAQALCNDAISKGVTCEYHEYNSTHEGIAAFSTDIRARIARFLYSGLVTAP